MDGDDGADKRLGKPERVGITCTATALGIAGAYDADDRTLVPVT